MSPPGCMTIPSHLGLELVSLVGVGRFETPSVDRAPLPLRGGPTSEQACRHQNGGQPIGCCFGSDHSDGDRGSFTWDTALRVRAALNALGVRTAMSRGNDTGLGPCVDARAEMANSLRPNAILSIHADGGPPSGRGFHVNYSAPPLNQAQAGPSVQFARIMRDQLQASGIPPANYIGQDGLYGRSDLAGLNLAQYPSILVECGNMKNPLDAALLESPEGRQKYADAMVRGVAAFLATQGQAR